MSNVLASLPRIGYGAMSLSSVFGEADHEESKATLRKTIELASGELTLWDTADVYGANGGKNDFGHNERLLAEILKEGDNRSRVFLVTKFGFKSGLAGFDGSPDYARKAIDASIERLGTKPDAWIIHRIPKDVPIKDVVEAMDNIRKSGKVKYIGIGEPSARTLREASKYAKIDFIESEYSPFCLDLEDRGILQACKELDVKVLAFSPLGKGFLTGKFRKPEDLGEFRQGFSPKFAKEVFDRNFKIVEALEGVAKRKGCTPGQLSLAWAIAQDDHIIPIPGTRSATRLQENVGALKVKLTPEELKELRDIFETHRPEGDRYQAQHQKLLDED